MSRYIGTKIILAEAMTRAAYNAFRGWQLPSDENGGDEGYLVEYTDGGKPNVPGRAGYVSWSPKEQFDNAYRPCNAMTFGLALDALKRGARIARAGWNGQGMWVAMGSAHPGLEAEKFWNEHARMHAILCGGSCPVQAYILMKTAQGDIQMGWAPTQSDALAEDWLIVTAPVVSNIPAHQQRVCDEFAALAEKLAKLSAFLVTPTFERLPDDEQARLSRQVEAMNAYRQVLVERIAAF